MPHVHTSSTEDRLPSTYDLSCTHFCSSNKFLRLVETKFAGGFSFQGDPSAEHHLNYGWYVLLESGGSELNEFNLVGGSVLSGPGIPDRLTSVIRLLSSFPSPLNADESSEVISARLQCFRRK